MAKAKVTIQFTIIEDFIVEVDGLDYDTAEKKAVEEYNEKYSWPNTMNLGFTVVNTDFN